MEKKAKVEIKKTLTRGDQLLIQGKNTVVVEVIAPGRYHVKNQDAPFDSFIITDADLEVQEKKEDKE